MSPVPRRWVLLVDDDPHALETLADVLLVEGIRSRVAGSLAAALDAIEAEAPGAILVDLVLEDGTGLELAARVRARHPQTPIFYTSAYTDMDLVDRVIRSGESFFPKPIQLRNLLAALKDHLRRAQPRPMGQGPQRVLLVDDDERMLESLSDIFQSEGFEVVTATDGREALDALTGGGVDGVLSDIVMPRMDGLELARRLRERHPELPIVLLSAYYTPERWEELGGPEVPVFPKPVSPALLLRALRQQLANDPVAAA